MFSLFPHPHGGTGENEKVGNSGLHLFEDHDIATLIVFPKGEGCQASHFHHIVSGKERQRGKSYVQPRGA